ncbi:MAG: hypothetical protein WAO76_11045 [Georgfuchsia sp.]
MKDAKLTLMSTLMLETIFKADSALGMSVSNLPPEKPQGAMHYVSGGIGQEEATAMKQAESKYPLSLEFGQHVTPNEEYLASVDVRISAMPVATDRAVPELRRDQMLLSSGEI